jgi:ABC-type transport system substrate-binding protein
MDHTRLRGLLATGLLLAVAACASAPEPTSTPVVRPAPSASPSPSPTPEQTLMIALDGDLVGGLSNAADDVHTARAAAFLYNGLYGYDDRLTPVPALARDLATVTPDGLTWTIELRDGIEFHDGTPLTADDVVQTYELARSANCRFERQRCLSGVLATVAGIDDLTVSFTLRSPMASFGTTHLGLWIESKDAIDASHARFRQGLEGVTVAEVSAFLEEVSAEEAVPTGPAGDDGNPTVDHGRLRSGGEDLLRSAGMQLPSEASHTTDGVLDVDRYVGDILARIRAIDASFTSRPIDALAAAYPYLDFQEDPVGTGPFEFASYDPGARLEFVANEAYFLGVPAIQRLSFPIIATNADAAQALAGGDIDWNFPLEDATYDDIRDDPDLRFVEYPEFSFLGLYFNLHPESGGLFVDRNLRQAVSYCFDKPSTAATATDGHGTAIYSDIPPMSWAYPPTGLNQYPTDPVRARELIEASGWTRGEDGIYMKDDRRLATVVAVREGFPQRTRWLEVVAEQVRACGIELGWKEVPFTSIVRMLDVYPHVNAAAPDTRRPFDAYLGGFGTTVEPDPFRLYHSTECSSAERSSTFNFICYQNPAVDGLIEAGRRETDPTRRATIYHQYAVALSQDLPVIYAWSDLVREGIRASIGTTAPEGLRLDSPTWFHQVEKLTNVK